MQVIRTHGPDPVDFELWVPGCVRHQRLQTLTQRSCAKRE
jgi:hypothetical protein